MCSEIDRIVVTTDSSEIIEVAEKFGAFIINRPAELAEDTTPMWPVVKHTLQSIEDLDQRRYESIVLLQPTSPFRNPQDIQNANIRLNQNQEANGIVSVSIPDHNPYWYGVIEDNGWMDNLFPDSEKINRRQEIPDIFMINGLFYIWKRDFLFTSESWRNGKNLLYTTPQISSIDIDDNKDLIFAQAAVDRGLVNLPWIKN